MINKENIELLLAECLAETDIFPVEISVSNQAKIDIVLDADSGLTIEKIKMVSRNIERALDPDNNVFELNVSSPGIDRPLKLMRQYKKNIGRQVQVSFGEDQKAKGFLREVNAEHIVIEPTAKKTKKGLQPNNLPIPFTDIKETKVLITF